jgi:hypothetical protein
MGEHHGRFTFHDKKSRPRRLQSFPRHASTDLQSHSRGTYRALSHPAHETEKMMTELTLNELQTIDGGDGIDYLWGMVAIAGVLTAPLDASLLAALAIAAGTDLL